MRWQLALVTLLLGTTAFGVPPEDAVVEMIPPDGDGVKYWPRWRGPSGQGVVPDGDYPDTWSSKENVRWKVEVPGNGNSSPIIWKDRIYVTTSFDNGTKRAILCFDRKDGKKIWDSYAPDAKPESPKDKNGWASGTPSTDGERIYAYFGNHGLVCIDMQGQPVWHKSFGEMDAY